MSSRRGRSAASRSAGDKAAGGRPATSGQVRRPTARAQAPASGRSRSAADSPDPATSDGERSGFANSIAVTIGAYLALFLLGLLQGLIGTFQYSRGPVPLTSVLFDLLILVTCMLGARGMRTALGGVLPAAGWFLVTLVLSAGSQGGSVFITDSTAGKWFLFGGALSAAAGAVYAFARWSQASRDRRKPQP